ncbi:MAG TPA: MFS transporter [Caulobacteraceae bacterium]|jgi:predicted MFS family arabinose efflux permease|nr:MFS transporter [Caulobacteraceae bacterium]
MSLVAALILVRFVDEWATFLPAGALEPIRREIGLTYAQAAAILVALPAGGILGNVFVVAADHVSRRWLASLGAVAYALSLIAFGLAHTLPTLLAAAFVWGAASDAFIHGCEVALVDLAEDGLPRALARMNAWAAVGDLLGPLTLALCALVGISWRGVFLGGGVAVLGYAAWIASQRLPPPHPPEKRASVAGGILATLRDRRLMFLGVVLGLYGLLDEPLAGFTIAYLERVRGLSPTLAALPVEAILVGGMVGFGAFERIVGGRAARSTLRIAAVLMALALPAMLFLPNLPLEIAAAFAFGAAGAVFYTSLNAVVLAARPGRAGATSAVVSSVGMIGMGFPALVGWVADAHGLTAGVALYAAIPLIVLALIAADRGG